MLSHLQKIREEFEEELRTDSLGALGMWPQIELRSVPDYQLGSSVCSVSGAYLAESEPPVLAVAESASLGRQAFTALHELGHHLQQSVFELMDIPMSQPDGGIALEDAACDAFAAAILLPKALVEEYIPERGPSGTSVASLWSASNASRAAACVRAARMLKTPGHVALLDGNGLVSFSASRELPPLRRGSDQSQSTIIRTALQNNRRVTEGPTAFFYRDGIRGEELHAQAADMGGMLVVVAVTEGASWLKLSLPKWDAGPKGVYRICEHSDCGREFRSFEKPCEGCRVQKCPDCGRCKCGTRLKEKTCSNCFMVKAAHLFDPKSAECRDCA